MTDTRQFLSPCRTSISIKSLTILQSSVTSSLSDSTQVSNWNILPAPVTVLDQVLIGRKSRLLEPATTKETVLLPVTVAKIWPSYSHSFWPIAPCLISDDRPFDVDHSNASVIISDNCNVVNIICRVISRLPKFLWRLESDNALSRQNLAFNF